jgi:hypothetical protein
MNLPPRETAVLQKNRVWEIFDSSAKTHLEKAAATQQLQWEIAASLTKPASGVLLYAHGNPAMFTDPSGYLSLGEVSLIGAGLGTIGSITLSYVKGTPITPLSIIKGAASGAILAPLTVAAPIIGVGLGIYSVGATGILAFDTLTGSTATTGQKSAAIGLVVASIWGGAKSIQYLKSPGPLQFPLNIFGRLPGGIKIRATQPGLNPEKIGQIPALIRSMRDGNQIPPIGGWKDGNTYYIGEGHTRLAAALELAKQSGNFSHVMKLLNQGRWTPGTPASKSYDFIQGE